MNLNLDFANRIPRLIFSPFLFDYSVHFVLKWSIVKVSLKLCFEKSYPKTSYQKNMPFSMPLDPWNPSSLGELINDLIEKEKDI